MFSCMWMIWRRHPLWSQLSVTNVHVSLVWFACHMVAGTWSHMQVTHDLLTVIQIEELCWWCLKFSYRYLSLAGMKICNLWWQESQINAEMIRMLFTYRYALYRRLNMHQSHRRRSAGGAKIFHYGRFTAVFNSSNPTDLSALGPYDRMKREEHTMWLYQQADSLGSQSGRACLF